MSKIKEFFSPPSITLKLLLFISIIVTFIFLSLGFYIEKSVKNHFKQMDLESLSVATNSIKNDLLNNSELGIEKRLDYIINAYPSMFIFVEDKSGVVVYFSDKTDNELLSFIVLNRDIMKKNRQDREWKNSGNYFRIVSFKASYNEDYNVILGMNINFHEHYIEEFKNNLWIATIFSNILAILLCFLIVKYALFPIKKISQKIQNTTSKKLNQRLEAKNVPYELKSLVYSFNEMIENIEMVFEKQANFSDDIAHELRTPLGNLITQTQIMLNKSRTIEEYQEILYSNLEEFARLSKMVNDMLYLSKSEKTVLKLESINLKKEIEKLLEYFEILAEEESVFIDFKGESKPILADKLMIQRVISNLLSNAINYAKKDTTIKIELKTENQKSILLISNFLQNDISEEDLKKLFDRFYRVERSRNKRINGTGIGLSIVKTILDLHKATIDISKASEQITFKIIFS
ncbi:MAG: heavy metal sensor histidine kinase [Campylobacteraceae bacterium]